VSKKIVWATDGSEAAELALAHAKTLAADGGDELLVLSCEEMTSPGPARDATRLTS
jgi:nucleotide-binding universal stress UspA family protein